MTAAHLTSELATASASLARCKCGSKVVMSYTPGCTYIYCLAERETKLAAPDWNPTGLAERWNNERKP